MKKILALSLIAALAVSHVDLQAGFWANHKGKIIAGLVAAGIIISGATIVYYGDKTKNAVEDAGIKPSESPGYGIAMTIVGLLGPLGKTNGLNAIQAIANIRGMNKAKLSKIFMSPIGIALANFYGLNNPQKLIFGASLVRIFGVTNVFRGFAEKLDPNLGEYWDEVKSEFSWAKIKKYLKPSPIREEKTKKKRRN